MSLYPMNSCLKSCEYATKWEPIVVSGELASAFTHQFSTKPYCTATGFSEYQMRKYRAEIGRWLSRDTLDATLTINDLASANNNLIDNIDFLGNIEIIGIGACLLKCGIESAFEELVADFFARGVFCGDLKRECEENFVDYLVGKISTPFPPPHVLPPPTFGKSKRKRISNCLFKCLKLDKVGLSISSDVKLKESESDSKTFSCNEKTKRVSYSLDISMEMYIEPAHKMIFEKQSSITGSCGRVAFGTCCPCGGK
jgi:RHS repeat-associated protein